MSVESNGKVVSAPADQSMDNLTALNNDCILEILSKLNVEGLCAARRTCKKLRALVDQHVQREPFQRKYIKVPFEETEWNEIVLYSPLAHGNHKTLWIEQTTENVSPSSRSSGLKKISFDRGYFVSNVEKVRFDGGNFPNSFGNQIAGLLRNVKVLSFGERVYADDEFYENVLNKCQLRQLECANGYIPVKQFAALQRLSMKMIGGIDQQKADSLNRFCQMNPTMKEFVAEFRSTVDPDVRLIVCLGMKNARRENLGFKAFEFE